MTILFSNSSPKINQAFLVPNLGIIVFREILQTDNLAGDDFKYENTFLIF